MDYRGIPESIIESYLDYLLIIHNLKYGDESVYKFLGEYLKYKNEIEFEFRKIWN